MLWRYEPAITAGGTRVVLFIGTLNACVGASGSLPNKSLITTTYQNQRKCHDSPLKPQASLVPLEG